jgi:hypothetical protein
MTVHTIQNFIEQKHRDLEYILEAFIVHSNLRQCVLLPKRIHKLIREIYPELIITPWARSFFLHRETYQTEVETFVSTILFDEDDRPKDHEIALGKLLGYHQPMNTAPPYPDTSYTFSFDVYPAKRQITIEAQRIVIGTFDIHVIFTEFERYQRAFEELGVRLMMCVC